MVPAARACGVPIMKYALLQVLVLGLALLPAGCGHDEPAAASGGVDTSRSEKAFASAEAAVKAEYEKVASAIKATDWSAAGAKIQSLASNVKLSDEQKAALAKLGDQIKTKTAEMAEKARAKAGQLAEDARKAGSEAVKEASKEAGKLAEKAKDATGKAAEDVSKAVGDLLHKK